MNTNENKYENYFHLLNHWMRARWRGYGIKDYLLEHGYKKIAIYGISDFANHLFDELENSEIEILYGIDRESYNASSPIEEIYSPNDNLPEVDAVIVTTFYYLDEIKDVLGIKLSCPIVSLERIVWSI